MVSDNPVILWYRKDLRLDDNLALVKSVQSGRPIIPLYIHAGDSSAYAPLGAAQRWWLHHSLEALQQSLEGCGSRLLLRQGEPADVLTALCRETGADVVAVNIMPDPKAQALDEAVRAELDEAKVAFHAFEGALLHDPAKVRTGGGTGYRVYTPFWRGLNEQAPPFPPSEQPKDWRQPEHWPKSESLASFGLLPQKPDWAVSFSEMWQPGEAGAHERLEAFCDDMLKGYATARDVPSVDGTSRMSPHLALGEISPRRIWASVAAASRRKHDAPSSEDVSRYQKELVWREFSYHLLHHFPDLAIRNWNAGFDAFAWENDSAGFRAWTRGQTGYPIVDAGMRQLWTHGWMHNRVRMITASFLIKDLLIDWRKGEQWFNDTLVDADPGSNAASWQWVAGSGADASPFFRIFNPLLQGEKFDAEGAYVREYVPELAGLPDNYIHRPFEAPAAVLEKAGVKLGKTYPKPVVDHRFARDRALAALSAMKPEKAATDQKNQHELKLSR